MSALERASAPLLLPLIRGESVALADSEVGLLRTWITKTALMTSFTSPEYRAVVTSEVTRRFFADPAALPTVRVWTGRFEQVEPQVVAKVIPRLMDAHLPWHPVPEGFYYWVGVIGELAMCAAIFPSTMWIYDSTLTMNAPEYLLSLTGAPSDRMLRWPPGRACPTHLFESNDDHAASNMPIQAADNGG
jgi:hypothetical protein